MSWPMIVTQWLLRAMGGVISLSFLAIFLPRDWMAATHAWLGLGELPEAPIVEYLSRTISAMYFAHAVVVLYVSTDVQKYWPFVGLLGVINVVLGAVFLATDVKTQMPWFWTWLEGPPIIAGGVILLVLWRSGRVASTYASTS